MYSSRRGQRSHGETITKITSVLLLSLTRRDRDSIGGTEGQVHGTREAHHHQGCSPICRLYVVDCRSRRSSFSAPKKHLEQEQHHRRRKSLANILANSSYPHHEVKFRHVCFCAVFNERAPVAVTLPETRKHPPGPTSMLGTCTYVASLSRNPLRFVFPSIQPPPVGFFNVDHEGHQGQAVPETSSVFSDRLRHFRSVQGVEWGKRT